MQWEFNQITHRGVYLTRTIEIAKKQYELTRPCLKNEEYKLYELNTLVYVIFVLATC